MKWSIFFIFLFINLFAQAQQIPEWTWQLKKNFSPKERLKHKVNSSLSFNKTDLPQFSQLIFSWNAARPTKGYFTFWGQVRDARTKKWYEWHKMMEWGAHVQRSFFSKNVDGTIYNHVRLDMPTESKADAVRIMVEPHDGADLSLFYALYVSISDLTAFSAEVIKKPYSAQSVRIWGVPVQSQMVLDHPKKDTLCSPTSCSMLIGYFTKKYDSLLCADQVFDTGLSAYGSWPFNTAYAFEACSHSVFFYVTRLKSFAALHSLLKKKIPVIVSVRGPLANAPLPYQHGHLLVVVGWDKGTQKVICHDPAHPSNAEVVTSYPLADFLTAWERSRRLSYIAMKKSSQ